MTITRFISLCWLAVALSSCAAINSRSVDKLVEIESRTVESAVKNAETFKKDTSTRVKAYQSALKSLDQAISKQDEIDSTHALIFTSPNHFRGKQGVDAHAAAYMVAEIYLAG